MADVRIGGQAVIEGVMMKNKEKYAIAVRKPDKDIEVKVETYKPAADKGVFFRLPIIRGVFNFVESLVIGVKTLTYSASFYDDEEDEKQKDIDHDSQVESYADNTDADKKSVMAKKEEKSDSLMLFFTVAFSIILAVGLFMLLPAFLVSLLDSYISSHIVLGLLEGVIRLAIFLLYVFFISRMEDIKRTFMYHGAEHKSINCLEAGNELTVENVMKASRFHKRCGTSFLFIVMIVSILVFMCIDSKTLWIRLLLRVLLVPVIAGISYEFIRYAGNHNNACANVLSKPGLWVQRLTTIEPTPDMAEVAIKAVEGVFDWKEYLDNNAK